MGKFVFDLVKIKTVSFSFFSFLVSKQTKEHILFQAQPFKMLNTKLFFVLFSLTVNIFWGPASALWVLKHFGKTCRVSNFFSLKNHSTLLSMISFLNYKNKNSSRQRRIFHTTQIQAHGGTGEMVPPHIVEHSKLKSNSNWALTVNTSSKGTYVDH